MTDNKMNVFETENTENRVPSSYEGFVVRQYRKMLRKTINFLPLFFAFVPLLAGAFFLADDFDNLTSFCISALSLVLPFLAVYDRFALTRAAETGKVLDYKHFWVNTVRFVVILTAETGFIGLLAFSYITGEMSLRFDDLQLVVFIAICYIDLWASFLAKLSLKKALTNNASSRFWFVLHSVFLGLIGLILLGQVIYSFINTNTSLNDLSHNLDSDITALFGVPMLILYCVFEMIRNILFARVSNKIEGLE